MTEWTEIRLEGGRDHGHVYELSQTHRGGVSLFDQSHYSKTSRHDPDGRPIFTCVNVESYDEQLNIRAPDWPYHGFLVRDDEKIPLCEQE